MQSNLTGKLLFYSTALVFIFCIAWTCYIPSQSEFKKIIIPYIIAFGGYILLLKKSTSQIEFKRIFLIAIISRFIVLFSFPNLSDDIYRFIWDGRCLHLGISPFQYLPSEIVGENESLSQKLFLLLNSPDYFSIYPPIGQAVAYIATLPIFTSYYSSAIIFKLFVFMAEVGSILIAIEILKNLKINSNRIFIYALNPLIIIELTGNIHFEAFMIFFLLLALYFLMNQKILRGGFYLALSICSKLLPLMFLPLVVSFTKDLKKVIRFGISSALTGLILFAFFLNMEIISNLGKSIGLYVNKFEFNAGIYYFLRGLGYWIKGFNTIHIIGPFLSILTVVLICSQALHFYIKKKSDKDLFTYALMAFCTYLLMATIVHPWYMAVPLILCVFTPFRFPVLWSFLIFFTYSNYSADSYNESLWIVAIEYFIVISFMTWEIYQYKKDSLKTYLI